MNDKKLFIKISRSDQGGFYVQPINELDNSIRLELDDLEYGEVGDSITFTVIEMTEKEYKKLPEFEGW